MDHFIPGVTLLASSIVETIGRTPLVELTRLTRRLGLEGRLLVKLEYFSPGGSKKDRVALEMVREARSSGALREGQPVVELTSGNTGTGLAIACRVLGHRFTAVMSRGNSIERARMMTAFGAEVVLVDQAPGSVPGRVTGRDLDLVEAEVERLVMEQGAYRPRQFENAASVLAHERGTGLELIEQAGGRVDVYVDCPGTSGSLTGVARVLNRHDAQTRIYVVEPAGAAVLAGECVASPSHPIQGAAYGRAGEALPLYDPTLVDGFLQVSAEDVISRTRLLALEEGVFAGPSTGAHLAAAIQLLEGRERGATVAFLACDSGLKYLSTEIYP